MTPELRTKFLEITYEKLLLALLLVGATFAVNITVERFKLGETARIADSSEYVKACAEMWSMIYKYEDDLNSLSGKKDRRATTQFLRFPEEKGTSEDIAKLEELVRAELHSTYEALSQRRYLLGEKTYGHFDQYVRLLIARAQMQDGARDARAGVYSQKTSREAAESLTKLLPSLRFNAAQARQFELEKGR